MCSIVDIGYHGSSRYFMVEYVEQWKYLVHKIIARILEPKGLLRKLRYVDDNDNRIIFIDALRPDILVFESIGSQRKKRNDVIQDVQHMTRKTLMRKKNDILQGFTTMIYLEEGRDPYDNFRIIPHPTLIKDFLDTPIHFKKCTKDLYKYTIITDILNIPEKNKK